MTQATRQRAIAVETDKALAEAHRQLDNHQSTKNSVETQMRRAVGDQKGYGRWAHWTMTDTEVAERLEAKKDDPKIVRLTGELAKVEVEIAEVQNEVARLDQVYRDHGGWNRYFLVNNNNGHIHRGMDCSTCYPTTTYMWLIELADCDEAEMVAEYGEMACTVCFPDAPTFQGFGDGTSALAKLSEDEKAAKAAAKDAKDAAKAAKAITNPDGTPLREDGTIIKTERAASIRLTDYLQNTLVFGYTNERYEVGIKVIAEALAHKRGQAVEEVLAEHEAKARKR